MMKFKKLLKALRRIDYVTIYFTDVDGNQTMVYSGELDKLPWGEYYTHKNDLALCLTPDVGAFNGEDKPYSEIELYEKGCNIALYE